ncbi:RNA polymerase sigma factor [Nocardiopsis composta]
MTDVQQEDAEAQTGDDELLSQVRGGDTAAFGTLWERHVDAARGLARQLVRGEAEAEDAVADTFTRVLDVVRRGGGPGTGSAPICSPRCGTASTTGPARTSGRSSRTTWSASTAASRSSTPRSKGWSGR